MARSVYSFHYSSFEDAKRTIETILSSNGYLNIEENGENVWKNGTGMLTAMKYIKIEFSAGQTVNVYGWIRPMMGQEQNLNGIVAVIPKKSVEKLINQIGASIR